MYRPNYTNARLTCPGPASRPRPAGSSACATRRRASETTAHRLRRLGLGSGAGRLRLSERSGGPTRGRDVLDAVAASVQLNHGRDQEAVRPSRPVGGRRPRGAKPPRPSRVPWERTTHRRLGQATPPVDAGRRLEGPTTLSSRGAPARVPALRPAHWTGPAFPADQLARTSPAWPTSSPARSPAPHGALDPESPEERGKSTARRTATAAPILGLDATWRVEAGGDILRTVIEDATRLLAHTPASRHWGAPRNLRAA